MRDKLGVRQGIHAPSVNVDAGNSLGDDVAAGGVGTMSVGIRTSNHEL